MIIAAPAMNPTIAACERKSTRNPNLQVSMSSNELVEHGNKLKKVKKELFEEKGT